MPEGIEEMLPAQAELAERLRRQLIDLFHTWGYELVMTPMIEYVESLLMGRGDDLDLQTFKLTDQLTGRTMGVRADMTPQAARIDAHRLKQDGPTRLCYLGTVLHTRSGGFAGSRSPMQIGAELFGHAGPDSDVEVLSLMLETLAAVGVEAVHLDLGHVGIFRGLAADAVLSNDQEALLFDALQRKAVTEMDELLADVAEPHKGQLRALVDLNGGAEVLETARKVLADAGDGTRAALANLEAIAGLAKRRLPDIELCFDLAELRGYHFHTGLVFAAFVPGHGQEVARGGRYDEIGKVFGRARPATGFSADLKTLLAFSDRSWAEARGGILAPADDDADLPARIASLRADGERVIQALPDQLSDAAALGCDRVLKKQDGGWQVVAAG